MMRPDRVFAGMYDRKTDVSATAAPVSPSGRDRASDPADPFDQFVTIIMPALNEAACIEAAISSITPKDPPFDYEILVADGGSTDGTQSIVNALAAANDKIKLISNLKRIQSSGVNFAAKNSDNRSTCLVRADCHAVYSTNFVEDCVRSLRMSRAQSVVVPMTAIGRGCVQSAIAAAQNSVMGNGGAAHRNSGQSRDVDHGHHAAFDKRTFLALGGYDENLSHNEDAEYDVRLRRAGGRIRLNAELTIQYVPRSTFSNLARQYINFGYGRATTMLMHQARPRVRQILPSLVLVVCVASIIGAAFDARTLLVPLAYVAVCAAWGLSQAVRQQNACLMLAGAAAGIMHMSWATGFLMRLAMRREGDLWRGLQRT